MSSEQKHNISFIPFFFFITYKILTCERRLYLPFTTYKSTTESAAVHKLNSGYKYLRISSIRETYSASDRNFSPGFMAKTPPHS